MQKKSAPNGKSNGLSATYSESLTYIPPAIDLEERGRYEPDLKKRTALLKFFIKVADVCVAYRSLLFWWLNLILALHFDE